jgi:hypothetical protein
VAVDRETPLGRWSRLKRARAAQERQSAAAASRPAAPDEAAVPVSEASREPPAAASADRSPPAPEDASSGQGDLPDPETLGKDADFTRYLKDGVPEALQRRALRALWRSDPVLANLDGLNDYDEDYRQVGTVAKVVRTAWRAGRGYAHEDAAATDTAGDDATPAEGNPAAGIPAAAIADGEVKPATDADADTTKAGAIDVAAPVGAGRVTDAVMVERRDDDTVTGG